MHILFLHSNFPAQFGEIAVHLTAAGDRCTFINERFEGEHQGVQCFTYQPKSGATPKSHPCTATFENQVGRSHAAALRVKELVAAGGPLHQQTPDLIVAHSGFVSPVLMAEVLPGVPVIGYFEFFYHRHDSDFDFRSDLPPQPEIAAMRMRARNAGLLLDLNHCVAGYCPTNFQRSQMPAEYQPKLRTIFDGIDTEFWKADPSLRSNGQARTIAGVAIAADEKVITYVSRGFESMRGSDQFLHVADRICRQRSDVRVIVVGEDRVAYGGDERFTGDKTFRQWVIDQNNFDLSRIHFVGRISREELVRVFSASDVHLYWTVPFVLSWSMINAMSCGCCVAGSATPPVEELIDGDTNGILVDFFDVDRWVDQIVSLLDDGPKRQQIGQAARDLIERRYAMGDCLEQMRSMYQDVLRS